jgi:hypothetical protein
MSDDCQKKIVFKNGVNWGEGNCKKTDHKPPTKKGGNKS